MRPTQTATLERNADAMRFLLDGLASMLDERLPTESRIKAAHALIEAADLSHHLYQSASATLDVFRDIANSRTDVTPH